MQNLATPFDCHKDAIVCTVLATPAPFPKVSSLPDPVTCCPVDLFEIEKINIVKLVFTFASAPQLESIFQACSTNLPTCSRSCCCRPWRVEDSFNLRVGKGSEGHSMTSTRYLTCTRTLLGKSITRPSTTRRVAISSKKAHIFQNILILDTDNKVFWFIGFFLVKHFCKSAICVHLASCCFHFL